MVPPVVCACFLRPGSSLTLPGRFRHTAPVDVLLTDRDLPGPGVATRRVDGAHLAAQNIVEKLYTPLGSLPWSPAGGSAWTEYLNRRGRPAEILEELRRVAVSTPNVYPQTVRTSYNRDRDEYRLSFTGPYGSVRILTASDDSGLPAELIQPPLPGPGPVTYTGRLLETSPGRFLLVAPGRALRID